MIIMHQDGADGNPFRVSLIIALIWPLLFGVVIGGIVLSTIGVCVFYIVEKFHGPESNRSSEKCQAVSSID